MKAADWLNSYDINMCRGQIIKEPLFVVLTLPGFFLVEAWFSIVHFIYLRYCSMKNLLVASCALKAHSRSSSTILFLFMDNLKTLDL